MLEDVKTALRLNGNALDTEIQDLIDAAKYELALTGIDITKTVTVTVDQTPEPTEQEPDPEPVLVEVEVIDPLLKRAIILYCKAHFGYDNPEADRFQKAYDMLRAHLSLSEDYRVGE